MTVQVTTLAQWREWTALPFDQAGLVEAPDALVPVHCVPEHDYAVDQVRRPTLVHFDLWDGTILVTGGDPEADAAEPGATALARLSGLVDGERCVTEQT
jgi:hypothetical protein